MKFLPHSSTADGTQASPQLRKSQARTIGIASVIWVASIFLSRIMGLLREQIIGRTLGASREADLYFASFAVPDWTAVAMVVQCSRRSRLAGNLCRDATHAGGVEGTDQQDGPQ